MEVFVFYLVAMLVLFTILAGLAELAERWYAEDDDLEDALPHEETGS